MLQLGTLLEIRAVQDLTPELVLLQYPRDRTSRTSRILQWEKQVQDSRNVSKTCEYGQCQCGRIKELPIP